MAYSEELANRVRTVEKVRPTVTEKKMFGGLAFMLNGNMFCGITHDLRRTYISNLLDSSGDLAAIQALARHANVNTTAPYDRRGIRAQEAAAQTIHVPYQRPP